jgi:hypothetical protein
MWIEYASAVERERNEALAEAELQTQHSPTSWVLDAALRLGWKPPALAAGTSSPCGAEKMPLSEMPLSEMIPETQPLSREMATDIDEHPEHFSAEGLSWARWAIKRVGALEARIDALEKENYALMNLAFPINGNCCGLRNKGVGLHEEGCAVAAALAAEEKPVCDCVPGHVCELHTTKDQP